MLWIGLYRFLGYLLDHLYWSSALYHDAIAPWYLGGDNRIGHRCSECYRGGPTVISPGFAVPGWPLGRPCQDGLLPMRSSHLEQGPEPPIRTSQRCRNPDALLDAEKERIPMFIP